ncbi:MAG: DHH family phosphoesterase [Planctomycetes bacterium]|nr:DHH family phosphoesterase [Planctomycetota bacterium]
MADIDIFNGDADGICALVQLRNAEPRDSRLVTGVKRDIQLVAQAGIEAGDRVTVLDISFDKNRDGVVHALEVGAEVFYVDHHFAGEIPDDPRLSTKIDTAPDVCTSLLVNQHLGGAFAAWAVVGAFGDNLDASANGLGTKIGLDAGQLDVAARLGRCVNYNGYGASLDDLHFTPADLFAAMRPFASPFEFCSAESDTFERLETGYREDMARAAEIEPSHVTPHSAVFTLPDAPWARRVSGVYGNDLAKATPSRAHAVLTERPDGTYLVSVRAPLDNKTGADELCRAFPTGGGRKAAAGINALPAEMLDEFVAKLDQQYGRGR